MLSKFYGYITAGLVIVGLSGLLLINKAKTETAELKQDIAEQQRDTLLDATQQILVASAEDARLREKLNEDFQTARNRAAAYRQKLAEHDLATLAVAKPDTLTRLARAATDRVLRAIEAAANSIPASALSEPPNGRYDPPEASPTHRKGD